MVGICNQGEHLEQLRIHGWHGKTSPAISRVIHPCNFSNCANYFRLVCARKLYFIPARTVRDSAHNRGIPSHLLCSIERRFLARQCNSRCEFTDRCYGRCSWCAQPKIHQSANIWLRLMESEATVFSAFFSRTTSQR